VPEARILPPYERARGLGSDNVAGLSRLAAAVFNGAYPLTHIDFEDDALPVKVSLDAFSPFIPHDAEESGLPLALLRCRPTRARVFITEGGDVRSMRAPSRSITARHHV